ncbi:LUD domain-containing protein [Halobellus ruber]|uniref:LUD domain-containing protein n=1 Tax=Halobellus ruber TaxID=2761102 RepID=A0A7J9SIK7_9EURY|nr:LUD domain-containing protein [Halobellus ruber]MBB6646193.1 LUD domain-containing protein [Halobellus ruber]
MSSDSVATFERRAADRRATVERTTVPEFDRALADCLAEPAVGVPLPFDGVSLANHPVEIDPSPATLEAAATGVTPVGPAVAEYGSVVVPSDERGAEAISLYPETHVAVLAASDVHASLSTALAEVGEEIAAGLSSAVFATGPSATADMGAPVYGVHGPAELRILLLEDR